MCCKKHSEEQDDRADIDMEGCDYVRLDKKSMYVSSEQTLTLVGTQNDRCSGLYNR